ncbi:MAG: hypothetical protein ISN28_11730 [Ectothiorhodospiraceae bacterium AqS1]|nr:hypothetical protein [Ectothiorhodospiraceae bacterium AqS1]
MTASAGFDPIGDGDIIDDRSWHDRCGFLDEMAGVAKARRLAVGAGLIKLFTGG